MGINLLADDDEKPVNLLADDEEDAQEEEQFLAPKKEGLGTTLPRDIMIGLLNQRQNFVNLPHDLVKNLEEQGKEFSQSINERMPLYKYIGNNKLPFGSNEPHKDISDYLPNEQNDFAKLMGQKGTPSTGSWLIQKGIEHAPELYGLGGLVRSGLRSLPVTARGIINRMSGHKTHELQHARTQYQNLFNEANQQGITHVIPPHSAVDNRARIIANSQAKHHRALNEYLNNPTLENAHWAQSELGSLERHLDSIANRNGLTPTQHRTLRAARQARQDIRDEMFSNNALGSNPVLGERYQTLSNQYREHVLPYTRLEELTEAEQNRMLPKTAVKKLLKDDQFMIELSRKYPGLFLHTPKAKKAINTALGTAATIGGYEGLKKLLK
jgi:hypothetical protein